MVIKEIDSDLEVELYVLPWGAIFKLRGDIYIKSENVCVGLASGRKIPLPENTLVLHYEVVGDINIRPVSKHKRAGNRG